MISIKGYFSAVAAIASSLTRSAAGVFVLALLFLVVVLNVAALMRLFEWHWWLALPAAVLLIFIPILGWLAAVVFAIFGGVYLVGAGFDWNEATQTARTGGSFANMTIMEFDAYRRNVMPEGLAKACKEDIAKSLGTGSQLPIRASNYCECYGQASSATLTQADLAYQEKTGRYTDEATQRVKDAVLSRCGT